MSPKKCDRHVTVFVQSKYGKQLRDHQGLMAWLCGRGGKEPGKAQNSWEKPTLHRAWGASEQCVAAGACPWSDVSSASFKARGLRGEVGDGSFPKGLVLGDRLSRRLVTPTALAGTQSQPPRRKWRESGAIF